MQSHDSRAFLERWHDIVERRDLAALGDLLAPEIELGAPPYWSKLTGHALVAHLLGLILTHVEGFTYHREWIGQDGELALEFTGNVEGHELQGIDLISLDAQGRIVRLDVLMRPINSMIVLRDVLAPRVQEFLAG